MRCGLFVWLGMLPTVALAGPEAPVAWTADGHWFAYTVAVPVERTLPAPGWIFGKPATRFAVPVAEGRCRYRIYVSDVATGSTILLEDGESPLTSPVWGPDGHELAFGRIVAERDHTARLDIVIQDGLRRQRVLLSRPEVADVVRARTLPSLTLAWSPDGRYLVVPGAGSAGRLLVVRADNGMVLKSIDNASRPAWSPDSSSLALIVGGTSAALAVMDTRFGPPRVLADLGRSFQAPVWSRDGKTLLAVARRNEEGAKVPMPPPPPSREPPIEVLRVKVESGQVETAAQLAPEGLARDQALRGVAFTADRDREELFSSIDQDGQSAAVVWFRPRTMNTVSRFHPFGEITLRVCGLSVSPSGKALVVRFGPDDAGATLGVWNAESRQLTLVDPDDETKFDWAARLVATAQSLLAMQMPRPTVEGRPVERPTIVPVPGELSASQELTLRLRRIGRFGRPLCERSTASAADPELDAFFAEARLFFDLLREDYPAALASLETVEGVTTSSDRLERLLALRAQIYLGLGDNERAGDAIAYLRALESRARSRIERTPSGVVLTPEPSELAGWPRYLSLRLAERLKSSPGGWEAAEVSVAEPKPKGPVMPTGLDRLFTPDFGGGGGVAFPRRDGQMGDPADDPDVRVRNFPRRGFQRRMR